MPPSRVKMQACTSNLRSNTFVNDFADYFQRGHYGDLDNIELAGALRGWAGWREQQTALHPAHAAAIGDLFVGATAWLRAEARRRLAGKQQSLRSRLTVAELLAGYGDRLTAAGTSRWKCQCPWHDDTRPSLIIYDDGWAHCFACQAHRPVGDLAAAWALEVAA